MNSIKTINNDNENKNRYQISNNNIRLGNSIYRALVEFFFFFLNNCFCFI